MRQCTPQSDVGPAFFSRSGLGKPRTQTCLRQHRRHTPARQGATRPAVLETMSLRRQRATSVVAPPPTPCPTNNFVLKKYGPNRRVRWTRHSLDTGVGGGRHGLNKMLTTVPCASNCPSVLPFPRCTAQHPQPVPPKVQRASSAPTQTVAQRWKWWLVRMQYLGHANYSRFRDAQRRGMR